MRISLLFEQLKGFRDRITIPADSSEETLREHALSSPKVQEFVNGQQIRKVIVVPGKLVNLVVG